MNNDYNCPTTNPDSNDDGPTFIKFCQVSRNSNFIFGLGSFERACGFIVVIASNLTSFGVHLRIYCCIEAALRSELNANCTKLFQGIFLKYCEDINQRTFDIFLLLTKILTDSHGFMSKPPGLGTVGRSSGQLPSLLGFTMKRQLPLGQMSLGGQLNSAKAWTTKTVAMMMSFMVISRVTCAD